MKRLTFLIFLFSASFLFGQRLASLNPIIFSEYPKLQNDYRGGNPGFFQDLHQIFMKLKLKPCENKKEYYTIKYVVYPNGRIKYMKTNDSLEKAQNRCTYNLIKKSFPYLKHWLPAMYDGKKMATISRKTIYPDDLFEKYQPGYDIANYKKKAQFEHGFNDFRRQLMMNIDLSSLKFKQNISYTVKFVVNEKGKVENIEVNPSSGNQTLTNSIIESIKSIKGKWIPGSLHNQPIKSYFQLPISFKVNTTRFPQ